MENVPVNVDLSFLVIRTGKGDRSAFANLYDSTSAKLFGIICHIVKQGELADEALQDTYVQIWEQAEHFDPALTTATTWMATIARSRAIEVKARQENIISVHPKSKFPQTISKSPPVSSQSEALRRLEVRLKSLHDDNRHMILLAYYEGMNRDMLSKKFGKPVRVIREVLRRSLALL